MPEIEKRYDEYSPMVPVAYIGQKETKRDTLERTGTVWNGPGDVQMVDARPAGRLLRHPTVFIHGDKLEEYQQKLAEDLAEQGDVEDDSTGSVGDSQAEIQNPTENPDTETTGTTEESGDAGSDEKAKLLEDIQAVIMGLDQENPEHFTDKGKPKLDAVRVRMEGVDVESADVTAAWKALNAG